jgi:hypothetical protein
MLRMNASTMHKNAKYAMSYKTYRNNPLRVKISVILKRGMDRWNDVSSFGKRNAVLSDYF